MAERAHVAAIEALASFRNALIQYLGKARPALEDSADEVVRVREWLRTEQRLHWEHQARHFSRKLDDAQQALFSAELAKLRAPSTAEKAAVHKAKAGLDLAQEKLRAVKRAQLQFEKEAQPQLNQLEHLRTILRNDLPKAIRQLDELINRLDAYRNVAPGGTGLPTMQSEPGAGEGPADKGGS